MQRDAKGKSQHFVFKYLDEAKLNVMVQSMNGSVAMLRYLVVCFFCMCRQLHACYYTLLPQHKGFIRKGDHELHIDSIAIVACNPFFFVCQQLILCEGGIQRCEDCRLIKCFNQRAPNEVYCRWDCCHLVKVASI